MSSKVYTLDLKAFDAMLAAADAERAVFNGLKRMPTPVNVERLARQAVEAGLIDDAQADRLIEAQRLAAEVIAVDEFEPEALKRAQAGDPEPALKKAS